MGSGAAVPGEAVPNAGGVSMIEGAGNGARSAGTGNAAGGGRGISDTDGTVVLCRSAFGSTSGLDFGDNSMTRRGGSESIRTTSRVPGFTSMTTRDDDLPDPTRIRISNSSVT